MKDISSPDPWKASCRKTNTKVMNADFRDTSGDENQVDVFAFMECARRTVAFADVDT